MTGEKKINLSPEAIYSLISEYDVFRYYIGYDFKINRPFKSPFHKDDHPSFIIGNRSGSLYFFDFADSSIRGKPVDFVMKLFGLDFKDALRKIDTDFGLGIANDEPYTRKVPVFKPPVIIDAKPTIVQVKTGKFTNEELKYWNEYYQDINDLKSEDVYAVRDVWINRSKWRIPSTELIFGYLFEGVYWKIYRPFAKREDKWRSNTPIDVMDGLRDIQSCKKAVVTKSKKDKMVIRKIFPCVCSVQNESLVALNEDTITYLKSNAEEVYLNYDCDVPGKKNSFSATKEFGFKHINVPDDYFIKEGIKDFACMAKEKGIETVVEHFKTKGVI